MMSAFGNNTNPRPNADRHNDSHQGDPLATPLERLIDPAPWRTLTLMSVTLARILADVRLMHSHFCR